MQNPAIVISGNPTVYGSINTHVCIGCNQKSPLIGERSAERKETPDYLHVIKADNDTFRDHRGDTKIYQISETLWKGRVLLISNEYNDVKDLKRDGAHHDRYDMVALWEHIGCDVIIQRDLTVEKIEKAVDDFVHQGQFSPANMYVVMIMSHGSKDDLIFGSKRSGIQADKIIQKIIKSEHLKDKPKLIFFQMCRGDRIDKTDGVGFNDEDEDESWITDRFKLLDVGETDGCDGYAKDYVSKTPDVLLAFASQPGHLAYRSRTGSWLIQSIKAKFAEHAATYDVEELMSMVKKDVGRRRANACGKEYHGAKEEVDYRSTFGKKKLFLFPGLPKNVKE